MRAVLPTSDLRTASPAELVYTPDPLADEQETTINARTSHSCKCQRRRPPDEQKSKSTVLRGSSSQRSMHGPPIDVKLSTPATSLT